MEVQPAQAGTAPKAGRPAPEITFEKLVHDFGEIGPGTKNICEFKFTNTGSALLKITNVSKSCGCTPFTLTKKQYAPGESGAIKITYHASGSPTSITKRLYVSSNDKEKPKVTLTIKAEIVAKVNHKPEKLNLLLKSENAGCPEITLTSRDKQPFTIKHLAATGNVITADYDPLVKATKFILRPTVNIGGLQKSLRGQVNISLTHPECKNIRIAFDTLSEFKVDPRVVYIRNAELQKSVTKKVSVINNYGEDFEIESTSSKNGTVKVLAQQKVQNGYEFELKVTPPATDSKRRVFTDVFFVKIKGGEQMQITCYGIYLKTGAKASR
jgi:limonene-1,2-epoxide hydrolase